MTCPSCKGNTFTESKNGTLKCEDCGTIIPLDSRVKILPSQKNDVIEFVSNYLPSPNFDGTIDPELFGFFGVIPEIIIEERLLNLYLEDPVFSYYKEYIKAE